MESFYGGRQGDSVNIVAYYRDTTVTETDDNGVTRAKVTVPAVVNMMNAFKQGATTTSDVAYGEYVLIETSYTLNENNGNLYRRGFGYDEAAVYKLRDNIASSHGFDTVVAKWMVREMDSDISDYASVGDALLATYFDTVVVQDNEENKTYYYLKDETSLSDYSFSQDFIDKISDYEIGERDGINKSINYFYLYSGAGAEYVGRILGPIGPTPEVAIDHYDTVAARAEDVNNIYYSLQNSDMYEAGSTDDKNRIHIDWVNVEDTNGNVVSWLVGFKIPYLKQVYHTLIREPYYTSDDFTYATTSGTPINDGDLYPDDVVEAGDIFRTGRTDFLLKENESAKKPYYHEWTLEVPKGVKGDSLSLIRTFEGKPSLYAYYTTYDYNEDGIVKNPDSTDDDGTVTRNGEYVGDVNIIDTLTVTESAITYSYTEDGGNKVATVPKGHLLVLYKQDKSGPITYNSIDGWYDLGLVTGKDSGGLRLYCKVTASDADTYAAGLGSTPPETYIPASLSGSSSIDYTGWGILCLVGTVPYSILYDYKSASWYAVALGIADAADPDRTITINSDDVSNLAIGGIVMMPTNIKNIYDTVGYPTGWDEVKWWET